MCVEFSITLKVMQDFARTEIGKYAASHRVFVNVERLHEPLCLWFLHSV